MTAGECQACQRQSKRFMVGVSKLQINGLILTCKMSSVINDLSKENQFSLVNQKKNKFCQEPALATAPQVLMSK